MGQLTELLRRRPLVADGLLALLVVTASVCMAVGQEPQGTERSFDLLTPFLVVGMTAPIAWRRSRPVAALYVIAASVVGYWVLDYPDAFTSPGLLVLFYSLAAHRPRAVALRHGIVVTLVLSVVIVIGVLSPEEDVPLFVAPTNAIVLASAALFGYTMRTRRAYTAEIENRMNRAEAQREAEARQAVAEERTRIARELHDVVAHSMSVMVVQAGAARRLVERDPARATEAIATIEAIGRDSLDEMRRILGVLRSADREAELAPQPDIRTVDQLVGHCREAGLPVDLEVDGEVRTLPPGLELSAYRVVQESLTNCLKHAGEARARVRLGYEPRQLTVEVCDDGRGASAITNGVGHGLIGMRERVEGIGGRFEAGPRAGGGFRVHAVLPTGRT